MTPQQIKQFDKLMQEQTASSRRLNEFLDVYYRTHLIDKTVVDRPMLFNANITAGKNGLKIGTSVLEKLGFFNVDPVVQQGAITAPAGGATVDAQSRTAIGLIITVLKNFGLTA